jgi:signal transduction histidine kinase
LSEIERLHAELVNAAQMTQSVETLEDTIETLTDENRKLEAMMRMRTHLQSNIAHELRTPMASVRGYTRMVLDGRAGEINSTQRDYLTIVAENTTRLVTLVNWMSHVLELAATYLKLSSFDLRDVWTECRDQQKAILAEKKLTLEDRMPAESFEFIGDRDKIGMVFSRFLAAAVKTAKPQSQILVEFFHGREKEATVKFSYPNDTQTAGIEIPEIEDIVGMHGGRLFVTHRAGERSVFHLTLPAVVDGKEKLGHEQAVDPGRRRR